MGSEHSTPRPTVMAKEASVRSADGMRIIEINLDANNDGHSASSGSIVFIIVATLVCAWLVRLIWRKCRKYRVKINRNVLPVVNPPVQIPMAINGPQPQVVQNAAAAPGAPAPGQQELNGLHVPHINA